MVSAAGFEPARDSKMMGYNRQPTYHARTVTALCIKALTGLESRNWPIIPLVIKEQPASSVVSCRIRIALRLYIPPRAQKLLCASYAYGTTRFAYNTGLVCLVCLYLLHLARLYSSSLTMQH